MSISARRSLDHVLVVSEDPRFIVRMQDLLRVKGVEIRGCLGPANTPCSLQSKAVCPLAEGAGLVIVDSPRSGSFVYEWSSMPAGRYAERLSRAHPGAPVILCGAPEGASGPSSEVTHVENRAAAEELLRALMIPAVATV